MHVSYSNFYKRKPEITTLKLELKSMTLRLDPDLGLQLFLFHCLKLIACITRLYPSPRIARNLLVFS